MSQKAWGIFLIVSAFVILAFVAYKNSARRQIPIIFSPRNELSALWGHYKTEYLEPGTGRVLDKQKDNITTSEGESYAMLRAVWVDDQTSFDQSWKWTKDNLGRQDNHLFSWLFGKQANGTYGVLAAQGGQNTATDADSDIALALVFASGRWNQEHYLTDAKTIINAIWDSEVATVNGKPYLVANNLEKGAPDVMVINPSYLSPYAYRIFSKLDPSHPWMQLVDSSYEVLNKSITSPLDTATSANIAPDWIFINKHTGEMTAPKGNNLTTNTSYDALRVPFRLYLDWQWYQEPRALSTLKKMGFFTSELDNKGQLFTSYKHDGVPDILSQSAAFYGGTLGYFMAADPVNAKAIYENKLQVLFNPDSNTWKITLGYYDDNWAWFGIALYNNMLPNLAAQ
jgi:endo-1,4-beta-D-glucanase Y